jgi:hypothetical protein
MSDTTKAFLIDSSLAEQALKQTREEYIMFPKEFAELQKETADVLASLTDKVLTLRSRIEEYHKWYPLAYVHPDTYQQTLEAFSRAEETLRKLGIQIPKCNSTLHETKEVRNKRLAQRDAAKKQSRNVSSKHPEGT